MPDDSWTDSVGQGRPRKPGGKQSLAQCLFPISDPAVRAHLEAFRIDYERLNGPTDLTLRYTSTWPVKDQKVLIAVDPERYFHGLPPFVQSFIHEHCKDLAKEGNLDSESDIWVQLFLSGATGKRMIG